MKGEKMKQLDIPALRQPMDRAGFLRLLFVAVLTVVGVTRLLEAFAIDKQQSSTATDDASGYGGTSYGR